ncbi:hypothetical protein BD289DRAFT_421011 [Coniella lustricola]|uniref:Putative lipoate-protein ligase A n=1 Tax=Coniella lustricola TaxID=2025994 RepID=A0A2T3ALS5_9PEZI|nr:hypothetical protein BD289DRAFT_421011 [Coniella lustricola]
MAFLCAAPWRTTSSSLRCHTSLALALTTNRYSSSSSSFFSSAFSSSSRQSQQPQQPWHARASDASHRVQIYTSRSHNPYFNLSAEHHLLQTSHPDSTILFLYANDPCIVIGRNQNPWLEVNLGLLRSSPAAYRARLSCDPQEHDGGHHSPDTSPVSLVRRRSGGGAVFHDRGNVNYSVICPPAVFDRDRHAEMVVRALQKLGVATAQVNARHDIVVVDHDDKTATTTTATNSDPATFKVSGSAYKLTRLRSLHHGTCLLSSPNLREIGSLLRSPAEGYIKARGVESVRSRIRNVGIGVDAFVAAVRAEFETMYGAADVQAVVGGEKVGENGEAAELGESEQMAKGYRELMSREWIYNQTPLFTFSTHASAEDPRPRPPMPAGVPGDFRATITARHGQIQTAEIAGLVDGHPSLEGLDLGTLTDWRQVLHLEDGAASEHVGRWLNHLFGIGGDERM